MSITRSDQLPYSRYTKGGTTTINGNKLGWWDRTIFAKSPSDITITLTKKYANRPDKLAVDLYGKSQLRWFILEYNSICDPAVEFVEGSVIVLPTPARLFQDLLSNTTFTQQM